MYLYPHIYDSTLPVRMSPHRHEKWMISLTRLWLELIESLHHLTFESGELQSWLAILAHIFTWLWVQAWRFQCYTINVLISWDWNSSPMVNFHTNIVDHACLSSKRRISEQNKCLTISIMNALTRMRLKIIVYKMLGLKLITVKLWWNRC